MRDGHTRRMSASAARMTFEEFGGCFVARLVVIEGGLEGEQFPLDRERVTVGRGPGVDLAFDNPTMSRQHAVFEYAEQSFRVRDLGSTNGIEVNGEHVQVREVRHGDRVRIGTLTFQVLVEQREEEPDTYELPSA